MFNRVPRLRKVYFCIPLRCGVILLIYLNLLLAAGAVIVFGSLDFLKAIARIFSRRQRFQVLHRSTKFKTNSDLFLYTLLDYAVMEVAMTVVMLVGIHKKRINLIKVYLHFTVILTIYMFLMRIFDLQFTISQIDAVSAIIYALAKLYYILAIRSLVKKTEEDDAIQRKMSADVEMHTLDDAGDKVLDESTVKDVVDDEGMLVQD